MPTTTTPTWTRHRAVRRAVGLGVLVALLGAGCGSSGGSDGAKADQDAAATTTTKADVTTTTEADEAEDAEAPDETGDEGGLPTREADAPSGDWISVRFNVAIEPEPDEFNPGSAEARLYDIEPDCSGSGPCSLMFTGGGDGGSFGMPDTQEIPGDR